MKLFATLAVAGSALIAVAPATAQRMRSETTVEKVHGPLKILPHHKHKICRVSGRAHHRTTKCWYH